MTDLRVMKNGVWATVQGEGPSTGTPAVFVRLAGCDLRCSWCDTPDSLPDYDVDLQQWRKDVTPKAEVLTAGQLANRIIVAFPCPSGPGLLVVTGGEPMLQQEGILSVAHKLRASHFSARIEFESNGETPPVKLIRAPLPYSAVLSPKVARWAGSHERQKKTSETVLQWMESEAQQVSLKIVVSSSDEIDYAFDMIKRIRSFAGRTSRCTLTPYIQIEYSWLRHGWLSAEKQAELFIRMREHRVKMSFQAHKMARIK